MTDFQLRSIANVHNGDL